MNPDDIGIMGIMPNEFIIGMAGVMYPRFQWADAVAVDMEATARASIRRNVVFTAVLSNWVFCED
jgi:hypothetical protein